MIRLVCRHCWPLLALALPLASTAQSIRFDDLTVSREEAGFVIAGSLTASNLNPGGQIVEEDDFVVFVDVATAPDHELPLLPNAMTIRKPPEAETSFCLGDRYLTRRELHGHQVLQLPAAAGRVRPTTVWRHYGGLNEWVKHAPPEVTCQFTGRVGAEHAGKTIRIRAQLRHVWGGPYAAWSAYSFHHDVGYEGPLVAGITLAGGGVGGGGGGGQPPAGAPEQVAVVTETGAEQVDLADGLSLQFSQPGYMSFPGPTLVVSPTGRGRVTVNEIGGGEAAFGYELAIDRQDAPITILTGETANPAGWDAIDLVSWRPGQTNLTVPLINLNAQTGVLGGDASTIIWKCTWQAARDLGAKVFTRDNMLITAGRTLIMFGTPYGFGGSMIFGGGALGLKWFAQRAGSVYDQGRIQRQLIHDYVVNSVDTTVAGSYHQCLVKSHGLILEPAPGQTFYAVTEGSFTVSDRAGRPVITVPAGHATWLCSDHRPALRPLGDGTPRAATCAEFYANGAGQPGADVVFLVAADAGLQDSDVYEYPYRNWNNANNSGRPTMRVSANVDGLAQTTGRCYLRFDLDRLGPVDRLQRVELLLTHYTSGRTAGRVPIVARRVTAAWQAGDGAYHAGQSEPDAPAGQVCWSRQPPFDLGHVWASTVLDASPQPETVRWDLTDLVRGWLAGDWPNHGLVLVGSDERQRYAHGFYTAEAEQEEFRPRLRIERRRGLEGR